jgi:hypothetical protein
MKRLVEKYAAIRTTDTDYTELLLDTNVFGAGRDLVFDEGSYRWLATRMSEVEARLDLEAAFRCISEAATVDAGSMKLTCDLEDWAFFGKQDLRQVLYIGCGAYPTIALYALASHPELTIDGLDIVEHCTVLCEQLADRLGLSARLRVATGDAARLTPAEIARYDGFFVSSAVRPKNDILRMLLAHKRGGTPIYAREDEAHPLFYEPVTVEHPDVLGARTARARWAAEMGNVFPLPRGCETS